MNNASALRRGNVTMSLAEGPCLCSEPGLRPPTVVVAVYKNAPTTLNVDIGSKSL